MPQFMSIRQAGKAAEISEGMIPRPVRDDTGAFLFRIDRTDLLEVIDWKTP